MRETVHLAYIMSDVERKRDVDVEASNLQKCGGRDGATDEVECCVGFGVGVKKWFKC